jgi:hypothetical protein
VDDVKRYSPDVNSRMCKEVDGDYVHAEDFDRLRGQLAEARELLDQIETIAVNDRSGCVSCTGVVNLIVAAMETKT